MVVTPKEQFVLRLKKAGYSATKPRLAVFFALQDREPQTMHDIVARLSQKVDRATVYRSVTLLEKLSIAQRLNIGWKYKIELAGDFHDHHHHLTCTNCGKLLPIPENQKIENYIAQLAAGQGFTISAHQLEIQGVCQDCQS